MRVTNRKRWRNTKTTTLIISSTTLIIQVEISQKSPIISLTTLLLLVSLPLAVNLLLTSEQNNSQE